MSEERWELAIPFIQYEVSNYGEIRNIKTKHVLSQYDAGKGYKKVALMDNGKQNSVFIHRLVARAFVENDDPEHKTQVNHINEDKADNRAENLEWVTPSENINHGTGNDRRAQTLSKPVVMVYKGLSVLFDSATDAERRTGIPAKSIQKCCAGKLNTTHGAAFAYFECEVTA